MTRPGRLLRCSLVVAAALYGSHVQAAEPTRRPGPTGEPPRAALDEAKALYVAGNRAVEQGRWSDALTSFDRSYQLSGVPAALFNVATTLRALGRHVEARDAFAQLLAGPREVDPSVRKKAEGMLAEEQARVASLRLVGLPPTAPELRLTLDGNLWRDDGARPLAADVDPGHHTLTVEAARSKPFTWEGVLADGEKKPLAVKLIPVEVTPATPPGPTPVAPPPVPEKKSSLFASPIFWTVVGVVVVGGAVAGGYAWHQGRQLDPGPGPVVHL